MTDDVANHEEPRRKLPKHLRRLPGRAEYYIDITRHGKRYAHSLQTTDLREAVKARDAEIRAIDAAHYQDRQEALNGILGLKGARPEAPAATVGDVVDAFKVLAMKRGLRETTARNYATSLFAVLDLPEAEARKVRTDTLSRRTVAAFERRMLEDEDSDSRRRSIVSMLVQARAMFSPDAVRTFEGLRVPDLKDFLEAGEVEAPVVQYMVPFTHPELVERTRAAITGLRADAERRDLFAAVLLMYGLALRNSEAVAARWSWIVPDPTGSGQMTMFICDRPDEGFRIKAKGSRRWIPIDAQTLEDLRGLRRDGDPFILLGGAMTNRKILCDRTLAAWMRGLGWSAEEFPKAGYELRKLRGSRWYTDREIGPAQASRWLGHASIQTTCRFYGTLDRQAMQKPI